MGDLKGTIMGELMFFQCTHCIKCSVYERMLGHFRNPVGALGNYIINGAVNAAGRERTDLTSLKKYWPIKCILL